MPLKRETSMLIWIADMKNREIYAHLAPVPLKRENVYARQLSDQILYGLTMFKDLSMYYETNAARQVLYKVQIID